MLCPETPLVTNGQSKNELLAQLKAHPAFRARPIPRQGQISSGFAVLDRLLGGGFAGGEICGLVGPAGCTSLALAILARATARGEVVAWVDPCDALDPLSVSGAGGCLDRFLWVRPTGSKVLQQAFSAADLVLDAGGFSMVVLDVGHDTAYTRAAWWIRLRRRLAGTTTVCIALGPAGGTTVDWRLYCQRQALGGAPLTVTVAR